MRALAVTTAMALTLPALATAHVTLVPPFVEANVTTEIKLETPNERSPHATVELSTSVPEGVEIVSASAPPGWLATVAAPTVTWRRGRIEGRRTVSFPIRLRAGSPARTVELTSAQSYEDGAVVHWKAQLSVLPATGAAAPGQHLGRALAAAIAGLAIVCGSFVALRFLRRRTLQD
jgi:uncharacterized protein YcnI